LRAGGLPDCPIAHGCDPRVPTRDDLRDTIDLSLVHRRSATPLFRSALAQEERHAALYAMHVIFKFLSTLPQGERPLTKATAQRGVPYEMLTPSGFSQEIRRAAVFSDQ
jgi:hypothetical protein